MIPAGLCLYCMSGDITHGRCSKCGHLPGDAERRSAVALPLRTLVHNRYLIGRILGIGGFGITYIAWDTTSNRRVALKELFPSDDVHRAPDRKTVNVMLGQQQYFEHVKKRFLDEARMLSLFLDNKEILDVYHLFPENNTAYYSMEFIEGTDLKHMLMKNGRMNWAQLSGIVFPVLDQLRILHEKGLIHRDISPDNICISNSGVPKLIDFGSVRTYTAETHFTTFLRHNFAPIEQYKTNGEQGVWTDIYAMSVTMYYAMSGKLPDKAPERELNDTVIPLGNLVPELPPNIAAAIDKGMSVHHTDRFRTVQSFIDALRGPSTVDGLRCIDGIMQGKFFNILPNMQLIIGRQPPCNILYPNSVAGISRRHCVITKSNGKMYILDESTFGTLLNGKRIEPKKWVYVPPGCVITVGKDRFLVNY